MDESRLKTLNDYPWLRHQLRDPDHPPGWITEFLLIGDEPPEWMSADQWRVFALRRSGVRSRKAIAAQLGYSLDRVTMIEVRSRYAAVAFHRGRQALRPEDV